MFAPKSNCCAVPGSATKEQTNSSRVGNDICVTPVTKNSEITNTVRNTTSFNVASRGHTVVDRLKASKPKATTLRCVVPECSSGGKSNSPRKWYVLPGFKVLGDKDSLNSERLKTTYSKLNLPRKYLGKSIQICSNHFPLKDSKKLNVSLESHTEDCKATLQHINNVELRSKKETTMKINDRMKINLRREDLSVVQPALNLTQMKCSDGNVHLMCSPGKSKTRQNIPILYHGVQEQNSLRPLELTGKPHGQMNLTINEESKMSKMESHKVFFNNIHKISPASNQKSTNINAIEYKYVSADGEVLDVTVDENDLHAENRFHQEETPPSKTQFQFVDIRNIINSSNECNKSLDEENSRILNENWKHDDSESLRRVNKDVHTKDVGVQTNDNYEFDEILHFLRKYVINFPFSYNSKVFFINNATLFFQPIKFPNKDQVMVQVREHNIRASCRKFLKYLNYSLWQKSGKSANELPLTYKLVQGLYEASRENSDSTDTGSTNLHDEVMYNKFINTFENESFQNVSNKDTDKSHMKVNSDKSECSFSNFDEIIHEIKSVGTAVSNGKDSNQIVNNDTTLEMELTNTMKNRKPINNNMLNSSSRTVENINNCVNPNSNSSQILTDYISNITGHNKMNLSELPKIKVINIANLRGEEKKNETREYNDEKAILGTSKKIGIEKEKSSLRRSDRMKKKINFAKIMKSSLSEDYGNVQLEKNRNFIKYTKRTEEKKMTVNCDIKKRKNSDENISLMSVGASSSKKGKYDEMIGELEKFLELTLEQPSEDIADLISLDNSYNLDYDFAVSSSSSMGKEYKSPDQKKKLEKMIGTNSNTKKKVIKTTGNVWNKSHSIEKHGNHNTTVTSMLTRSKIKSMKKVKNLPQNKQRSKRNELKVTNDTSKTFKDKNSKHNKKSVATPRKHPKNQLAKKIKNTVCINENLDHELKLKNSFKEICTNCKKIFDKRVLTCHLKICLKKRMCDHCGIMVDNRVMWCHSRMCFLFKCEECGLKFPDLSSLREHLLTLNDCFLCEKCRVIIVGSDLKNHLKKCKLPHRTSIIPVKDLSYIYSNNSKRYCKLCMQSFESFIKFTKHVYSSHRNESQNILLKMKKKVLKKYLKKRSKPNKYKCGFCGDIFKNLKEENDHYEICLKRIVEKCTIVTEEGTYIEAEVIM